MLTTATRAYTELELDEYSVQQSATRALTGFMTVVLAIGAGVISMLVVWGGWWVYTLVFSGSVSWKVVLIVGGAVTLVTFVWLWLAASDGDWTEEPPVLATDVTASADGAWLVENDNLDVNLVMRVEPDRYLLLNEDTWMPLVPDEKTDEPFPNQIPSNVRLVLLGEGEFQLAINGELSGPTIPVAPVKDQPAGSSVDYDDETRVPDGLYAAAELPEAVRKVVGGV